MSVQVASQSASAPTRFVQQTIQAALALFDEHVQVPAAHGNQRLHFRGLVGGLLAAAFEPAVWSLRPMDDLSLHQRVQTITGVDRLARSTLSDALKRFDPAALKPMLRAECSTATDTTSGSSHRATDSSAHRRGWFVV